MNQSQSQYYDKIENAQNAILIEKEMKWERLNPLICPYQSKIGLICMACEQAKQYTLIFSDDSFEQLGHIIIDFQEVSHFLSRCLCMPSYRPFKLLGFDQYQDQILEADKPFRFNFLCLSRQEISIKYMNQYIGKIREPCSFQFCKCQFHSIQVFDKNDSIQFIIKASLFQCGVFCCCPIKSCRTIQYVVYNNREQEIATITKLFGGTYQESCTKVDRFAIQYPLHSTVEEKVLLTMGAVFINYAWFENI